MKELKYLNKYLLKYKTNLLLGFFIIIIARILLLFTPGLIRNSVNIIDEFRKGNIVSLEMVQSELVENIFLILLAAISLRNFKENNKLINKYVSNWDVDRIAKIDLVILNLAITEIKDFKLIPVKVSLNEYIEISKDYSSEKSSFFINGVLDKFVKDLIEKKSLIKEGRGLRE